MAGFTIDLAGRVKNFDLPKTQPLIPLFEAVVNSIYAIEERKESEDFIGKIDIRIVREPQEVATLDGIDSTINEITGFTVSDNGIGLDENNMKSFLQSDSTYRAAKGGKGVGRFSWLKAFDCTKITSVYKGDDCWVKREFDFSLDNLDIDDVLKDAQETEYCTTVELISYKSAYRKHVGKSTESIATKIMQHCMIYLMSPNCPIISVIDEERYCINDMFEKRITREEDAVDLFIGNEKFSLVNAKIEDASVGGSKIYLYANERMVKPIDLDKALVDLDKNIYEDKGYYYVGILTGKYLDDNVEMNRTSFDISDTYSEDDISMDDIVSKAKEQVEEYLKDYLTEVREKKDARIRKYITNNAPQFGHLLKYMPSLLKPLSRL